MAEKKAGRRTHGQFWEMGKLLEPLAEGIEEGKYTVSEPTKILEKQLDFVVNNAMTTKTLISMGMDVSNIPTSKKAGAAKQKKEVWAESTFRKHLTVTKRLQQMNLRFNFSLAKAFQKFIVNSGGEFDEEFDAVVEDIKETVIRLEGGGANYE